MERQTRNGMGLRRVQRAFICSLAGLQFAWKSEAAFRQEVLAAAVLTPLAIYLGESGLERSLLLGSLLLVLIVELLNSAVEAVVDRISIEHHPLSGQAKDLGSAAVALAMAHVLVVWAGVLLL
ncbi:diacylglycerol kinase [Desulfogranum mediterraneum]|uniref:diacylglycerol kinase n=1 Tax=Desulfogranum mediterraneum TaxID=160661 RepID=UPI000490345E|nr:diacylglycerol kinase [Desulfogranum mediterraneum]